MIALGGAMFAAGGAAAQTPRVDCSNATSNVEIGYCLEQELGRQDAALNRIYQVALRSTREGDFMGAADKKKWEAALREAQRRWVAFRDADCRELTGYEYFGGTGVGVATLSCLVEKTKTRVKELTERYGQR